ncbi:dipeptide ABC transporter ATP-binding protein [Cohnella lubricantis]|uniref:Dipeptide ABC transporter ATP-binding protein n=1 Tax=Cohnella lubricantis TaxID=2163172 RepID=A0A841TDT9_9BACL|nr:dipeptide ABC transporter ATP-binding protein [Cohnella lubricantis]MBB6679454.1 dipeptide ABC transporter ATP-binding protein [Cohnella lubricantis]MBP2118191.1 peptide/nickel transport system ATP-binding protein/oligopeptide transport system ATP-binding protein [Cohnella lubricantis]
MRNSELKDAVGSASVRSAGEAAPLLELDALQKHYPVRRGLLNRPQSSVRAVDGVSLAVRQGEALGLVGESGCGKSTIGRAIVGLEKPTGGRILFEGEDMAGYSEAKLRNARTKLQMVFQDPYSSLNPRMTVGSLLAEPLRVHGIVPKPDAAREVDRLLDIVGLPRNSQDRYPHEFSGGQRQRIGIARALALKPKLIVCDEPVSALDVSIQAQVLNLLKDLQQEFDLTYLFIAHGLGAVRYISDRIAVMYLGKLVEVGPAKELFLRPKHPYTKALLDAYPVPNPQLRNRERIMLQGDAPSPADPPRGCRFHTRCPLATPQCRESEPELKGDGGHAAACFFPL